LSGGVYNQLYFVETYHRFDGIKYFGLSMVGKYGSSIEVLVGNKKTGCGIKKV